MDGEPLSQPFSSFSLQKTGPPSGESPINSLCFPYCAEGKLHLISADKVSIIPVVQVPFPKAYLAFFGEVR
jgi:hypothetical protein